MVFYHIRFQTKIGNKQLDDKPTALEAEKWIIPETKKDYLQSYNYLATILFKIHVILKF